MLNTHGKIIFSRDKSQKLITFRTNVIINCAFVYYLYIKVMILNQQLL